MSDNLTLADISEFIVDSEHKTAPTSEEGYPYIRTPNIGPGYFILDNVRRVSEKAYKKWTRRGIPEEGDLILAREAPVGNVAMVPKNLKPCLGQRTVLIRPNKDLVNPRYLTYLMLGKELQGRMHAMSTGATVPHLNMGDIRSLKLPQLPPLATQNRIAAVLSAYDDLIENNTRRIAILEEMAQLIYSEWFVHFRFPGHEEVEMVETEHGVIPAGWELRKVENITKRLSAGNKYKRKDFQDEGKVPVIDQASGDISGYHNNKPDHEASLEKPIIAFGDHTCRMYLMNQPFSVGPNIVPFVSATDEIPVSYLYFLLKDLVNTQEYKRHWRELNNKVIVKAPLSISQAFVELYTSFKQHIDLLKEKNKVLKNMRDLLLPRLISGEIIIADRSTT